MQGSNGVACWREGGREGAARLPVSHLSGRPQPGGLSCEGRRGGEGWRVGTRTEGRGGLVVWDLADEMMTGRPGRRGRLLSVGCDVGVGVYECMFADWMCVQLVRG